MAAFSYNEYVNLNNNTTSNNFADRPGINFFKLDPDGEALVRFFVHSADDLIMASVHKPVFGKKFEGLFNPYAGISCLNDINGIANSCPFCQAVANGHEAIAAVKKNCYVRMLVSYKDAATGVWSAPVAAIWERPAGFAKELVTKMSSYGDLTESLLKITRNGKGTDTRYSIDYAMPTIFKPEMIPADFSAFDNYKVNEHAYLERSTDEMVSFVTTGSFPSRAKSNTQTVSASQPAVAAPVPPQPAPVAAPVEPPKPAIQPEPAVERTAPAVAPAVETPTVRPTRTFTSFTF